jgi:hypothetical protein
MEIKKLNRRLQLLKWQVKEHMEEEHVEERDYADLSLL